MGRVIELAGAALLMSESLGAGGRVSSRARACSTLLVRGSIILPVVVAVGPTLRFSRETGAASWKLPPDSSSVPLLLLTLRLDPEVVFAVGRRAEEVTLCEGGGAIMTLEGILGSTSSSSDACSSSMPLSDHF